MLFKILMFALWGIAGLFLAIASSQCQWGVDPVLPSICLGTLIGFLLYLFRVRDGSSRTPALLNP
jgi:hypothetical protein